MGIGSWWHGGLTLNEMRVVSCGGLRFDLV